MKRQIKYFYDTNMCNYEYDYPTEKELLEMFPEANDIIPKKIDDWLRQKGKLLCKETIPFFKKVNELKDEFTKAFWKQAYIEFAGRFKQINKNLKRLKLLKAMIDMPKGFEKWEEKKDIAKSRPIEELYDFKKVRRTGDRITCLCPLHPDKDASFFIYPDNHWWCYSCNTGGDNIDFIQSVYKYDFATAVRYLAGVAI